MLDVERGEEFCGVRPADAAVTIAERGRTPITMDEGLCLLHAAPEALEKNKCFHTAASRGTDKRVPALWISKNAPHPRLVLGAQPPHLAGGGVGRRPRLPPDADVLHLSPWRFLRRQLVTAALTANAIRPVPGYRAGDPVVLRRLADHRAGAAPDGR